MPTDKKFTGQRLDSTAVDASGLYYYNARYYDAALGRFISPDTIVPDPAYPQSFNRYSYCLNNPLKYIDPSGHGDPLEDILDEIANHTGGGGGGDGNSNGGGGGSGNDNSKPPEPDLPASSSSRVNIEEPEPASPDDFNELPVYGPPVPDDYNENDLTEILGDLTVAVGSTIILVADDVTGVGIVDDALIAVTWGAFIGEHGETIIDGINSLWDFFAHRHPEGWTPYHDKGKRKSTEQQHTDKRPGAPEKKENKPGWKPR